MAAYNKFNNFVDKILKGNINLSTDTVKVMLTNTAPVATNTLYSDISANELANGNGYTTGGATVTGTSLANASGTESYVIGGTTFTSATGTMGPFRYAVYYDSTTGALIAWYDYGSSISLNGAAGETFVLAPGSSLFTLG